MGEKIRYLGCDGLGPKEITLIKSMLRLFEGKTQGRWQFSEQQPFDALLVPDGRTLGADAETEHESLFIRTALGHVHIDNPNTEERRRNKAFVLRPIRALTLLEKLNQISVMLDDEETQQALREQGWGDMRNWREQLFEWGRTGDSFMVDTTLCKFVIFPQARRFLCEKSDASARDLAAAKIRRYERIDPERATDILRTKRTESLAWLGWHTGHYGDGRLLPVFDEEKNFKLQRWPDFGSLDHEAIYVPIAGILTQRVVSLGQLRQMGNFPPEVLHRFLNAALLTGYLEFVSERSGGWLFGRRSENSSERLGMFARIRQKLGL
ncbi:MAG: hypothetical protein EPO06_07980 [Burkholderiaceae bacterium]|nr:MAG: hypothetical protein EPO06_07980 [Burkholderiaceae bacterium]